MEERKYQELPAEELLKLIAAAQAGDQTAREQVFLANQGLIHMALERFKSAPYDYQELYQIGSIGLLKAIDKFDASFGVRFSTYAVPLIIGELKRYLRDDGPVKIARNIKELHSKIRWAEEALKRDLGREPTVQELAQYLEVTPAEIVDAVEACQSPYYMFDILGEDERNPVKLMDRLEGDRRDVVEELALKEALLKLEPREQEVIWRRYFSDQTQSAVARYLGISQVQVSRIERSAIKKLRQLLA